MRRPTTEALDEARRLADEQRIRPVSEWAPMLPPATSTQQRRALLDALSPAVRAAAEAWDRRT